MAVLPGAAAQRASGPRFEPLWNRRLAGIWEGRKGVDLNPKAMGPERKEFIERIDLQPIDYQLNGPQLFYGLRYHTHILAVGEDATFHYQVGYWLWEPATGLVVQTLAIPRGQIAIAAGHASPSDAKLVLTATRGQTEYGICSTAFLEQAFRPTHTGSKSRSIPTEAGVMCRTPCCWCTAARSLFSIAM